MFKKFLSSSSKQTLSLKLSKKSSNLNLKTLIPLQSFDGLPKRFFTNFSDDQEKRLQELKLEIDSWRQDGKRAPDSLNLKPDQWEYLLKLQTRTSRTKYYSYLWEVENRKKRKKLKKEMKLEEELLKDEKANMKNKLCLMIPEGTKDRWHNNKLIHAMQFGQKLVIDCGYDDQMVLREKVNTAKQLMRLFGDNRRRNDPFDLHFCNANFKKETMKHLISSIPHLLEPTFPLNIHVEDYLELFPKEKLVYLTPHCSEDLDSFNPDDIYIIGAIVDQVHNNQPFSRIKAEKQGLRMAKLPLEKYLKWIPRAGKSLTMNQMLNILLDLKESGSDWNVAFKNVPQRKVIIKENGRQKLSNFKDHRFEFETWGATRLRDHSPKHVDRRLNKNFLVSETLDSKYL